MKANEAPEKIYYTPTGGGFYLTTTKPELPFVEGVEYTRTDDFIEKLECWLNEKGREYCGEFDEGFLIEFNNSKEAIEDFRKYIKGE